MTWLVIRVRSDRTVERKIRETMQHLNLTRVNHAVLIPESEAYAGMLQKVKDCVTWGESSADAIAGLIRDRGRLVGDKPVTDAALKEFSDYKTIDAFAKAIASGDATTKDMETLVIFWYECNLVNSKKIKASASIRHVAIFASIFALFYNI